MIVAGSNPVSKCVIIPNLSYRFDKKDVLCDLGFVDQVQYLNKYQRRPRSDNKQQVIMNTAVTVNWHHNRLNPFNPYLKYVMDAHSTAPIYGKKACTHIGFRTASLSFIIV